ncbi:MAG: hypothetical protein RLZZ598_39 [Pseudomonadota bacterium]|jgi:uncharacterized membrane protein YGL010W
MRNATQLLSDYAAYHRDRRNIATHFVGVPMIVFAVCILLSRPSLAIAGLVFTPAWALLAVSALWYLTRGQLLLGIVTSTIIGAMTLAGTHIAAGSTLTWLASGIGLFVAGWVIQFIGHHYEGRKPAFVDDLTGLMIGPMFVFAEMMFLMGWNKPLLAEIEARVGPTHLRDMQPPAA